MWLNTIIIVIPMFSFVIQVYLYVFFIKGHVLKYTSSNHCWICVPLIFVLLQVVKKFDNTTWLFTAVIHKSGLMPLNVGKVLM